MYFHRLVVLKTWPFFKLSNFQMIQMCHSFYIYYTFTLLPLSFWLSDRKFLISLQSWNWGIDPYPMDKFLVTLIVTNIVLVHQLICFLWYFVKTVITLHSVYLCWADLPGQQFPTQPGVAAPVPYGAPQAYDPNAPGLPYTPTPGTLPHTNT